MTDLQRKRDEAICKVAERFKGIFVSHERVAVAAFRAGFLLACEMTKGICADGCDGDLDFAVFKLDALREQGEKEL